MLSTKEIRERESEALTHELADKQKHLFDLRSQAVTEKLEDPSQIGKTRKEIARIKTIIRERELKTQKETQPKQEKPKQEKQAKQKKEAK
jgi:large subunit ribosomal protein L29